eukprot:6207042-Pleurochrysis_carterae.AAC.1
MHPRLSELGDDAMRRLRVLQRESGFGAGAPTRPRAPRPQPPLAPTRPTHTSHAASRARALASTSPCPPRACAVPARATASCAIHL